MDPAELVRVVPRSVVMDGRGWRGVRAADLETVVALAERHGTLRPRAAMEVDPAFKQLIPYVVLRNGRDYFLMRRTRAGTDARLHDRWSIGVGGHLNPVDATLGAGLRREWAEELRAGFVPEFRFVGLLNDDSTAVGRVHLGLVFEADAAGRPVTIRETEKLEGSFAAPSAVAAVAEELETWSRLVFEHLERRVTAGPTIAGPSGRPWDTGAEVND
jgi:predicted NUDIX family phosphoesterase